VYVVMVASELSPVAKAGGLGDMVFGLSREIEIRGNEVEIVLPKYGCMRYGDIWGLYLAHQDLWVPWFDGAVRCAVWSGFVYGRRCFFIEPHSPDNFFVRDRPYGYHDDVDRFAFFAKAAVEFLYQSGRRPDVIHCHDWQTGLVPVLLREQYQWDMPDQRVCYTVHNFGHQGGTDEHVLWATGLGRPEFFCQPDRLGDGTPGGVNLLRGGIGYADHVTTVSPRHAVEVLETEHGNGMNDTLRRHGHKFTGILNGVDYHTWNPEIDPLIPAPYTAAALDGKQIATKALRDRFWLRESDGPIVAYLGRLDPQKGMHLVHHALFYALANGGQFVLLGDPSQDAGINDHFWHLKQHLNDNPDVHLEIGYREELAHLVYAGADILVVPSMFEPCGLAPLTALRYGTVPVVRATGGMVDTVFDQDHSSRPVAERNGFSFNHTDNQAVESALSRAMDLWFTAPAAFNRLAANAMRADHSWNHPGAAYVKVYQRIRSRRTDALR
jgi:starch synthase